MRGEGGGKTAELCSEITISISFASIIKIEKLEESHIQFLVACYVTLHPALSVRLSVGPSVTRYFFFVFLWSLAPLLLPK